VVQSRQAPQHSVHIDVPQAQRGTSGWPSAPLSNKTHAGSGEKYGSQSDMPHVEAIETIIDGTITRRDHYIFEILDIVSYDVHAARLRFGACLGFRLNRLSGLKFRAAPEVVKLNNRMENTKRMPRAPLARAASNVMDNPFYLIKLEIVRFVQVALVLPPNAHNQQPTKLVDISPPFQKNSSVATLYSSCPKAENISKRASGHLAHSISPQRLLGVSAGASQCEHACLLQ
jgi:hypothetical protein